MRVVCSVSIVEEVHQAARYQRHHENGEEAYLHRVVDLIKDYSIGELIIVGSGRWGG